MGGNVGQDCDGAGGSSYTDLLTLLPGQNVLGFESSDNMAVPNSSSIFYGDNAARAGATNVNSGI